MQNLWISILIRKHLLVFISESDDIHSIFGKSDIVLALGEKYATDGGLPQLEALMPVHTASGENAGAQVIHHNVIVVYVNCFVPYY